MALSSPGDDHVHTLEDEVQERLGHILASDHHAHPLSRRVEMDMNIISGTTKHASCPNSWLFYLDIWLVNRAAFATKVEAPRPPNPVSLKDQLVTFVYEFFTDLGFRYCGDSECETFKQRYYRSLPPCRWHSLREFVATWVSCWQHTSKDYSDYLNTLRAGPRYVSSRQTCPEIRH